MRILTIAEFAEKCPQSTALFDTPNCSGKKIISKMMTLYFRERSHSSGWTREFTIQEFRILVARRLVSKVVEELTGGRSGVSSAVGKEVGVLVRFEMPSWIRLTIGSYNSLLSIYIPHEIVQELKRVG